MCNLVFELVLDKYQNACGIIVKIEYITVYASENIVPISATIPILIAESFSLDFKYGDTAIATAHTMPIPNNRMRFLSPLIYLFSNNINPILKRMTPISINTKSLPFPITS